MFSQQQKVCSSNKTAPSSHVNYCYLTTSEKDDQLECLHNLQRQTKRQVDLLSAKITENIEHNGVVVEEGIRNDLTEIVKEHTSKVNATFPVVYKIVNPHCHDRRYLYFFADPAHLLKTLRNAWANPKRHL